MPVDSWIIGGITLVVIVLYQFSGTETIIEKKETVCNINNSPRMIRRRIRKSRKYWPDDNN